MSLEAHQGVLWFIYDNLLLINETTLKQTLMAIYMQVNNNWEIRQTFDNCLVFQCMIAFWAMSRLCCFLNMLSIHALNALPQCKCPSRHRDPRAVPYKWYHGWQESSSCNFNWKWCPHGIVDHACDSDYQHFYGAHSIECSLQSFEGGEVCLGKFSLFCVPNPLHEGWFNVRRNEMHADACHSSKELCARTRPIHPTNPSLGQYDVAPVGSCRNKSGPLIG